MLFRKLISIAMVLMLSATLVFAGGAGEASGNSGMPRFITIGTGGTGAAFYPIGVAIAQILTTELGVDASAQVTGGAFENIELVQNGTVDLGITMGNAAQDAYVNNSYTNLNAFFGDLSRGYFQVVVLDDSPIQSMADLVGKRVCMGPAGNGAISVAELIWNAYGFGIDDVRATYLAYDDGITQLTDGNCDAVVVQAAIPSSAIQQLAAEGGDYRLIPVEEEIAEQLCEQYTYFGYGNIASDTYMNNKSDTMTIYNTNMVIVRADLAEDVVYQMSKAVFDNLDTVVASHSAAAGITVEGAARTSIPLHPGSEKYFREIGVID